MFVKENPNRKKKKKKKKFNKNIKTRVNCFHGVVVIPAGIYLLKVNSRNTRTSCEICFKVKNKEKNDTNDVVLVP